MTVTLLQATALTEGVLFESGGMAANSFWVSESQLVGSTWDANYMAKTLAQSPEATIAEQVVRYYQGALGRVPSAGELQFYVTQAESSLTAPQIIQGASAVPISMWSTIAAEFAASPEFQAKYSTGSDIIAGLYQNILGRTPTADEVAFYTKAIAAGTSPATLLQYFVNSPEYQNVANPQIESWLASYGAAMASGTASSSNPLSAYTSIDLVPPAQSSFGSGLVSISRVSLGGTSGTTAPVLTPFSITPSAGIPGLEFSADGNPVIHLGNNVQIAKIDDEHYSTFSIVSDATSAAAPASVNLIEFSGGNTNTINVSDSSSASVLYITCITGVTNLIDAHAVQGTLNYGYAVPGEESLLLSESGSAPNTIKVATYGTTNISGGLGPSGSIIQDPNGTGPVHIEYGTSYIQLGAGSGDTVLSGWAYTTVSVGANLKNDDVIGVGANSVVTLSTNKAAEGQTIDLTHSATLSDAGDAAQQAGYAPITIVNALDGASGVGTVLRFPTAAQTFRSAAIDVLAAQSALNAVNIAAGATGTLAPNSAVLDWFQYGGNTYIVEVINNESTPMSRPVLGWSDIVVELTGLINVGAHGAIASGNGFTSFTI